MTVKFRTTAIARDTNARCSLYKAINYTGYVKVIENDCRLDVVPFWNDVPWRTLPEESFEETRTLASRITV